MLDVVSVLLVVAVGVTINQVLNDGKLAGEWLGAALAFAGAATVVTHKTSAARAPRTGAPADPGGSVLSAGTANRVTRNTGVSVVKARDITIYQYLPPLPQALISSDTATPPPTGATRIAAASRPNETMLDHDDELVRLRRLLTGDRGGIVVVHGPPGVGKTALVDTVLGELERSDHVMVRQHEVVPGIPLDVRTLTDDLTGETASADTTRLGKTSLALFEAALRTPYGKPVVIVIERAENLLHPGDRQLADLDLDEALEILTRHDHAGVTLVLVSSVMPEARHGGIWHDEADRLQVRGLPYEFFDEYLHDRDKHVPSGLSALPEESKRRLCAALRGNPYQAGMAYAILTDDKSRVTAPTLVQQLAALPPRDVPRQLVEILLEGLDEVHRRPLDALAACRMPVSADTVSAILTDKTADFIAVKLQQLVARRIVLKASDLYYLPASELRRTLNDALDLDQPKLLHKAASALHALRERRMTQVNSVVDLQIHFAELQALIRARRFATAYRVIESIDNYLREWNCGHLLLEQRQFVQGKLDDTHQEMANDDRLGYLYTLQGSFSRAQDAYRRALEYAEVRGDAASNTKIHANLATLYWQRNETRLAYDANELVRQDVLEHEQPVVLMGALNGKADCLRRWGEYAEAIEHVQEALAVHNRLEPASAAGLAASRAFRCNLKLARWHTEIGQSGEATRYLEAAEHAANARNDQWLVGAYLDGQAALRFSSGDMESALTLSAQAVDHALKLGDPVTLMQARTTACMAYLARREEADAAREIEWAYHYRYRGRSLLVLALLALVQKQRKNTVKAEQLFKKLHDEATERIERDDRDFGARDFLGFALCGQPAESERTLDKAIEAFQTARRQMAQPAPLLVERMRFLLTQLDRHGQCPGRLQPVIDACGMESGT